MSKEIVENILEQIKGLALSERNKFSSYKTRNLRQELSEAEAVIKAAARVGVYPTIQQEAPTVLDAVGKHTWSGGKLLSFPIQEIPQTLDKLSSNNLQHSSNTAPTECELGCERINAETEAKAHVLPSSNTAPTTSNTSQTVEKEGEGRERLSRDWTQIAKSICYGAVFFLCTAALVYLSAEAAGGEAWAYFWAVLTEAGGIACIIHPARGWNKAGLVTLGVLCIAIGYSTMLTGVFKKSSSDLTETVSTNQGVKDLEEQIAQAKTRVTDAEKLRDDLPPTWVSKKREAQKEVDKKAEDLTALYASVKAEREKATKTTNANIIGLWTGVEGFRRFILLVFSIVVGHAFFRSCTLIASKWLYL